MPGGGGAAGVIAAAASALCSMVANLTIHKSKGGQDIQELLSQTEAITARMLELAKADEKAFEPLGKAMSLKKDDPNKPAAWDAGVAIALSVPMALLRELSKLFGPMEELADKGYSYAISDVGVAASACRCAMESTILNVYINARFLKDPAERDRVNGEAEALVKEAVCRCEAVYEKIKEKIQK